MKSEPLSIIRLPTAGKYYVQNTAPDSKAKEGDIWWNTATGGILVRKNGRWTEIKLSGVALMDACITNHLLAADINAGKIKAGRLESQNGEFMLDLESGEAMLQNMSLGGRVQGNVIAESNDGKMRIRLVGKDPTKDVSAQIVMEGRENIQSEWTQKGLIWLGYNNHATAIAVQNIEVGTGYNRAKPTLAHNHSERDGILVKPYSQDYLRAAYATYHGYRLVRRNVAYDTARGKQYSFENVPPVNVAIGNVLAGEAIQCEGVCTQTYLLNEIAQIDFDLTITTAGSGSAPFGISRALLRQLNEEIPVITPMPGGCVRVYSSAGALLMNMGGSMGPYSGAWAPMIINADRELQPVEEQLFVAGTRLTGTCYGRYAFEMGD